LNIKALSEFYDNAGENEIKKEKLYEYAQINVTIISSKQRYGHRSTSAMLCQLKLSER